MQQCSILSNNLLLSSDSLHPLPENVLRAFRIEFVIAPGNFLSAHHSLVNPQEENISINLHTYMHT